MSIQIEVIDRHSADSGFFFSLVLIMLFAVALTLSLCNAAIIE